MSDININVSGTITIACPDILTLAKALTVQPGHAPDASAVQPVQPAQPAPTAMPNTPPVAETPAYTAEQLSRAGAELAQMRPDLFPQIQSLLTQFGIPTISEIKPEQINAFAVALRQLGANI